MKMNNEDLQELRRNITAIIDDIKYHSDSLTPLERLPVIQLKVILAKINKLTEKTTILLHYVEKQGKLSDKAESTEISEMIIPEEVSQISPVSEEAGIELKEKADKSEEKVKVDKSSVKTEPKRQDVQSKLKKLKVSDLNTAIGINEKYLFASVLFKGDTSKFSSVIKEINALNNSEELKAYLDNLHRNYNWDSENEIVMNFLELVERKFDQ